MKIEKTIHIKTNYSFEAPLFKAAVNLGLSDDVKTELRSFDLGSFLIPDPTHTYLVRVVGESMIDENIYEGDILVVHKNEEPDNGKVVIASLNGETAVKTYRIVDGNVYLYSANKKFLPIEIKPFWEFEIQGVVKHVIRNL